MKTIQTLVLTLLLFLPMTTSAVEVLKVHGENTAALTVKSGQAMAVGLEVTRELKNVTFEFNSAGIKSKGGIAINKEEIGEQSRFAQTMASKEFSNNEKPASVLKVNQLSPGRDFIVVWVEEGSVVFGGSESGVKKEENGAKRLMDYHAAQKATFAPRSKFDAQLKKTLHFTVHEAP